MGQSFFSSSVEISGNMRPFVALTFVMGCAYGAPADLAVAGTYAGLGLAGVHGLGYAAAAPVAGVAPVAAAAPIAYPTVLKGTQTVNAPIVTTQTEIHNVQSPVFVERKVDAPYDAPFYTQKIVEVPTPVHVDAPYNVAVPVAVQGEPIIKKTVAAPVVTHSHHVNAAPAAVGY